MRVLIDTNILISAALSSSGTPYKAFLKAVTYPNKGVICDQNIEELRRIFNRKFPQKISLLEHFLSIALLAMEVIPTPNEEAEEESYIRDVADRPILRAALNAKVDVLLTGDKEFLESGVVLKKSSIYAISKQNCLSVGNDLATDFLYSMNKILYKHVDILKTKGIDEIRKHAYNNTNRTQHASQRCGPRWVF